MLSAVGVGEAGVAGNCAAGKSAVSEHAVTSTISTTVSRCARRALQVAINFGMNRNIVIQSGFANGDYHSAFYAHTNRNRRLRT